MEDGKAILCKIIFIFMFRIKKCYALSYPGLKNKDITKTLNIYVEI